ncbi:MAG: hypothetical protein COA78_22195 [Blastopirellula sp.]|nr:MAG: hypothetical protein COA78_22195 [Blastopirellula sp.]
MSVIAWLIGSKFGRYLATALTFISIVGVILLKAVAYGRTKEQLKQTKKKLHNLKEGVQNDQTIRRMSPSDRANKLRDEWSK